MRSKFAAGRVGLYRLTWSHALGAHWLFMRTCAETTADLWKREYEKDDSGATYIIALRAPKIKPGDEKAARHFAPIAN